MKKKYYLFLFLFTLLTYSQNNFNNPICDFDNLYQTPFSPSLGSIGCCTTTPNSSWHLLEIGNPGNLLINLHCGDNTPLYNNQDIDFVCWGPFDSIPTSNELYGYNSNTSIPNNIIDCSYSPSATESIDIMSAQSGKYYLILTTYFSNTNGFFKFDINPISTANLACGLFCSVTLGSDRNYCSNINSAQLTAEINLNNLNNTSFDWYLNNVYQTTTNTNTLTVNQSGNWKVNMINTICNTNPTDEVLINFNSPVIISTPNTLFGPINNCTPTIDLTQQNNSILNGLDPNHYTIKYHLDEVDSWTGENPIQNPQNFTLTENKTIFVYVKNNLTQCETNTQFYIDIDCPNTEIDIISNPIDSNTSENGNINFNATINNATALRWQMSTNGINWLNLNDGGLNPNISGATTNSLNLSNIPSSYNGNYLRLMASSSTDVRYTNFARINFVLNNEIFELNNFLIYPNPTSNIINILLKESKLEKITIKIFDMNGRLIHIESMVSPLKSIDISKFESGNYLLEFSNDNFKETKQIIKN